MKSVLDGRYFHSDAVTTTFGLIRSVPMFSDRRVLFTNRGIPNFPQTFPRPFRFDLALGIFRPSQADFPVAAMTGLNQP